MESLSGDGNKTPGVLEGEKGTDQVLGHVGVTQERTIECLVGGNKMSNGDKSLRPIHHLLGWNKGSLCDI